MTIQLVLSRAAIHRPHVAPLAVSRLVLLGDAARPALLARPRNAARVGGPAIEPVTQKQLSDYVKVLVQAYGWRQDFASVNPPRRVPFVPQPFAGVMLDYFVTEATKWLNKGAPSLQPQFIKNRLAEARHLVGEVRSGGILVSPTEASYEAAPPAVAQKAALTLPLPFVHPVSAPHPKVLTAQVTWRFLDTLGRLALHLDALAGAPSKADLWNESWAEAADEAVTKAVQLGEKAIELGGDALEAIPGGLKKIAEAPRKLLEGSKEALTTVAVVVVGALMLYLVTR